MPRVTEVLWQGRLLQPISKNRMRDDSPNFVGEHALSLTLGRHISSCDRARLRQTGGCESVSALPDFLQKTKTDQSASHVASSDTGTIQFYIDPLGVGMRELVSTQTPRKSVPFP